MNKTHRFYIITTVKPVRVYILGAVLPQARGRFTPGMGLNGFIGAHFKLVITYVLVIQSFRDMRHTQSIYIPQHDYCTIMHRQVMDTKIHNFSLKGAGLPQVTLCYSGHLVRLIFR